jgi:hypothetical protein
MLTYGGVPTMVEGLKVLKEVLQARGMWEDRHDGPSEGSRS